MFIVPVYAYIHGATDRNLNNPLAHELTTGPEIIDAITSSPSTSNQSSGKVDAFIAGAGTGGTITGVARAIKKTHNKGVRIVAIDPVSELDRISKRSVDK